MLQLHHGDGKQAVMQKVLPIVPRTSTSSGKASGQIILMQYGLRHLHLCLRTPSWRRLTASARANSPLCAQADATAL